MPGRRPHADGEAGGFNAVQKLLTNPARRHGGTAARHGVKARQGARIAADRKRISRDTAGTKTTRDGI